MFCLGGGESEFKSELLKEGWIEVIAFHSGRCVLVDASDNCEIFGFKSGDRIIDPSGFYGEAKGIVKDSDMTVFWYSRDVDRVSCRRQKVFGDNIKEDGFSVF